VVILGGEKPLFTASGPVGHAALGQMLEQKGFDYEPCHGKYQGDKQPSYIVHVRNDGEDETLKGIARRMGQESVVHSEGGKHQLVYLNGDNAGKATAPAGGLEWYGDNEPDDNYTTLYGASGEPLGHFKYNMDFDNPMVPDGPGPMVDVPEAAKQVLKSAVESYRGILLDLRKRETDKLSKKLNPGMGADRDQHTGSHPDGSSLSLNRPSHPFSEPARATSGGAIDGRIAKYMTEGGRKGKVRGNKPSSDISTQGPHGRSSPHSGNIVSKTENPMKLHDLMKSQAQAVKKFGEEGFQPTNKFSNKLAAGREKSPEGSPAAAGAKDTFTQRATTPSSPGAFKAEESMGKAQCQCGKGECKWCGKAPPKPRPGNEQGEHGGSPKKPAYQPGDEVKKSIWKKMPEMTKAQTNAHASAKRNGGTIKLGKQEFYLDHQNPTVPKEDDASIPGGKETGWRTGGQKPKSVERSGSGGGISGNKPKAGPDQKNTSENSVTEGTVPKSSGKNDLIEKAAADFHKRTGNKFKKYEYDNGKCKECGAGLDDSGYCSRTNHDDEDERPSPEQSALDEGRHNPQDFEKAAPSMGAPKAPSAGGAGSPTLSGGASKKPPTTHATANAVGFGKALMPFSAQQHGAQAAHGAAGGGAAPTAAPAVTPKAPSQFDPSLYAPPAGGVKSGLLTDKDFANAKGPMSGVGVTPRPAAPAGLRSPAQHKGITGFLNGKGG
jgi:hypothetical protein